MGVGALLLVDPRQLMVRTHVGRFGDSTHGTILPEPFLDVLVVILSSLKKISDGLHLWPRVARAHVMAERPQNSVDLREKISVITAYCIVQAIGLR